LLKALLLMAVNEKKEQKKRKLCITDLCTRR
jgi:hypothetical protein